MRLRGKGVPSLRGVGTGDQYVHLNVRIVTDLTPRQRELLEEFAAEEEEKAGRGASRKAA